MVLTSSKMLPLGQRAPDFTLLDVISEDNLTLQDVQSDIATVVMFLCNHCPYVKHIQDVLVPLTSTYIQKGITFVAVNSNDVEEYPEDRPQEMQRLAEKLDFPFPYLFDETQKVARDYGATCTPDFFVFDRSLRCVYRGQFDESRRGNHQPVTGSDLSEALDCILKGTPINPDQHPSIGCNIKWKREALSSLS